MINHKPLFIIVNINSKQYKITSKDVIYVPYLNLSVGEIYKTSNVLMISQNDNILINDSDTSSFEIKFLVTKQIKNKKSISFKKRRRQNSRRKIGYRQYLTELQVVGINKI